MGNLYVDPEISKDSNAIVEKINKLEERMDVIEPRVNMLEKPVHKPILKRIRMGF